MSKNKIIISTLLILFSSLSADCQKDKESLFYRGTYNKFNFSKIYITAEFNLATTLDYSNLRISDIPEYIRDIPPHKDDKGRTTQPIDDVEIWYPSWLGLLGVNFSVGYNNKLFDIKIGGSRGNVAPMLGGLIERNYTNAPGTSKRGYGAALTAYGFVRGSRQKSLYVRFQPKMALPVVISFEKENFDLSLDTGWDRYNGWEKYKKYRLLNYSYTTFKLAIIELEEKGVDEDESNHVGIVAALGFYIGYKFNHKLNTKYIEEINHSFSDNFIVGLTYRIGIAASPGEIK